MARVKTVLDNTVDLHGIVNVNKLKHDISYQRPIHHERVTKRVLNSLEMQVSVR